MAIVTLTSDWGSSDHYAAAVKAVIVSQVSDVNLIDITHHVPPFDLHHASFVVRNCYRSFPAGTIHIIDICSDASLSTPHMLVVAEKQYFIATDNGIFSLIFDSKPEKIILIDNIQDSPCLSFSARDVFARAAVHLLQGRDLLALGHEKDSLKESMLFTPAKDDNVLRGKVIYVDSYQNAYVNITESLFREVGRGRPFTIYLRTPGHEIRKLSKAYSDVPAGEVLAMFSSTGYLEIAINQGNAAGLLGMRNDEMVRIEFERK